MLPSRPVHETAMRSLVVWWQRLPRPVRFLFVGGLNTVFGYGAYAMLLFAGLHFAWASLIATVAGICFNYMTTGALVFERSRFPGRPLRFVIAYAVIYAINVLALAQLVRLPMDPYTGGLILVVPMALVSYLLMRTLVFGGPDGAH